MADTKYLSCADTAKLVRKALKEAFPGVKFSVRSDTYSGGASIRVRWVDGPADCQVEPVVSAFQGGYFDAATDYFTAVYTISHIQPGGEYKDRFRFAWYESGHMMYLRKPDLANSNQDVRDFIDWALEGNPDYPYRVRPAGG